MEMGTLGSGQVVVDRHSTHNHIHDDNLLRAALLKVNLREEQFQKILVEFDHVVGVSTRVETTDADEIVYAHRVSTRGRGLTRFVKNREPEPCKSVVVILMKAREADTYVLITSFIGTLSEPEPWDPNATPQSRQFWNTNALVWGSEEIVPGTETTICPW